jgi:predicted ribosome quality control (RQC) complex YloA/Tae2 family protein
MIQYYLDLEKQVKNIKEKSLQNGQIQKIYSTAFYISFAVRSPGKTWYLYFGRGGGHEGVWLGESPPPSGTRRKDTFLEYLRSHLSACTFVGLTLDSSDRIVGLEYRKFGEKQSLLWFWRGRKLYFLHHYQERPEGSFKLLLSWRGKAFTPGQEIETNLFDYFNEVGRQLNMSHDLASDIKPIEYLIEDELKVASREKSAPSDFLQRKKANIEADLRKTRQWEKLQAILERNTSLEEVYELKVDDQKIKFGPNLNPFERRNVVYQKIKKLKKGEAILTDRLSSVNDELRGETKAPRLVNTLPVIRPVWGEEKRSIPQAPQKTNDDYRVFKLDKVQIGVGVSATGNDQLRNKWANRDDYWIHLDGIKSAHAIVKVHEGTLNSDILNLSSSIVAHFSKFSDEWIPIIYTQVKNVKSVTGVAGMVTYKKEKHLRCPRVSLDDLLKE